MNAARVDVQLGRYVRLLETLRVLDVLVDEQVQVAHRQVGGRQPGEAVSPGGRGVRRHLVGAHRVAALSELKDYNAAVAAADDLRIPADWAPSRRGRHHVEVAYARLWTGDKDGSLADLRTARAVAPQQTRYDPIVQETVTALLRAQRSTPDTLANMAAWVGV